MTNNTDDESAIDFSTVLASSVHDMKNSVGMLLASIEAIVQRSPPQDDTAKKHFSTLHYEASRINGELIQLLTLYRMQSHFLPVRVDQHYVIDVLEEQVARNFSLQETTGIEVELQCNEDLNWYYDADLVGGMVHNILVNCFRYTRKKILICAELVDDMLCISVADDGAGYPASMLQNPQQMVDEAKVSRGNTHLGLYFASTIAGLHKQNHHRGYIKLENDGPLHGGVFRVYIP